MRSKCIVDKSRARISYLYVYENENRIEASMKEWNRNLGSRETQLNNTNNNSHFLNFFFFWWDGGSFEKEFNATLPCMNINMYFSLIQPRGKQYDYNF